MSPDTILQSAQEVIDKAENLRSQARKILQDELKTLLSLDQNMSTSQSNKSNRDAINAAYHKIKDQLK